MLGQFSLMRVSATLLSVTFLCTAISAQAQKKADRALAKQLQKDISYLAADSLEGRRTSTVGETKAGDYIVAHYTASGIPAYKTVYRYPFHFVYGKEIAPSTMIKVAGNEVRVPDEAFPLPFSNNKHAYSEVLPDVMESGNVWLVSLYADADEAQSPHFDAEKVMYDRSKEAQTQGATGVLFYDAYGSKWPPSFNRQSEKESLEIPVAFLGHEGYQKYIQPADNRTQRNNYQVDLNINLKKPDRVGTNIAAFIDNHAKYTVVIGAHYDHLGYGEDGNSLYAGKEKQIHNGADDNASGTAAVLSIADWVKRKHLHHYNYLFLNFSGEELGLLGSKAFIKDQKLDSSQIAYMINMDMVGRLNDSTHALTVGGIGTSPAWPQFISEPNKQFRYVLDSSGIGPSDHTSFYLANIPVLFLFTGTHRDYHKPSDDADKINYPGEVAVIKYAEHIISQMDGAPRPAYTKTKESATSRVNFKVTLGIMPDYAYQDGGVRVDGVSDNRPAQKAGMKPGDIITQLGSFKVQGMQSYMEALSKFSMGDKTTVHFTRDGKPMSLPIEFTK